MHELGQTGRVVADLLERAGDHRVTDVTLGVPPDVQIDTMLLAWEHATRDTPAQAAEVRWVEVDHFLRCLDCHGAYRGKDLDPCPACGGDGLVVERVNACELLDFDVDETNVPG